MCVCLSPVPRLYVPSVSPDPTLNIICQEEDYEEDSQFQLVSCCCCRHWECFRRNDEKRGRCGGLLSTGRFILYVECKLGQNERFGNFVFINQKCYCRHPSYIIKRH